MDAPSAAPRPGITLSFTFAEYAMLGRIVEAGMWEIVDQPHTPAERALQHRVCELLCVLGYESPAPHTPPPQPPRP